jgi:hypothetical protein
VRDGKKVTTGSAQYEEHEYEEHQYKEHWKTDADILA